MDALVFLHTTGSGVTRRRVGNTAGGGPTRRDNGMDAASHGQGSGSG